MSLLGYVWLHRCASLFLHCAHACEVTSSPYCTIRSVCPNRPALSFYSALSAIQELQASNASECGSCLTLTSLVAFNGKTRRLYVGECAYERSSTPSIFLWVFMFSQASFVCAVRYSLNLAVFLLQLALHFEIDLSFAFDTLLLHITDHTLMHCLRQGSARKSRSNSKMLTYGFIGHLLVVNEVNNTDRT